MPHVTEAEVFRACRTLFGPELKFDRAFLSYLQPSGARSAYRKKAKVIHPDRFAVSCSSTKIKQQRLFQDLNQAHQTVQKYLKQKKVIRAQPIRHSRPAYSAPKHPKQRQDKARRDQQTAYLPQRPLQFGQFLYYLGIIPFHALIAAITWQRRQRPVLGEIAKRWGWLENEDIRQIITLRSQVQKFGERAEHLGLLSSVQVRTLLFHQRSQQRQIGDYFVEQNFFEKDTKNNLLSQLADHNRTHRKGFSQHFYYFHR